MAQSDVVKVGVALIVGFAVAIVLAGSGLKLFGSDVETDLIVSVPDSATVCTVSGKATEVRVGRNKKLEWKIRNYCNAAAIVRVGNFRTDESQTAVRDCTAASPASVEYPFTRDGLADRSDEVPAARVKGNGDIEPGKGAITLKVKDLDIEPGKTRPYHYNICIADRIVDPRLIIER